MNSPAKDAAANRLRGLRRLQRLECACFGLSSGGVLLQAAGAGTGVQVASGLLFWAGLAAGVAFAVLLARKALAQWGRGGLQTPRLRPAFNGRAAVLADCGLLCTLALLALAAVSGYRNSTVLPVLWFALLLCLYLHFVTNSKSFHILLAMRQQLSGEEPS